MIWLGFIFYQCAFDIFDPMPGGVTVEVEGPVGAAVLAGEPFGGRRAQRSDKVFLHLAVPGKHVLG